ncbi:MULTISPECIES: hypothetical protein [Pseudomonas]|uniref:N-acetyltransferase n=1 Tax=Pseudomonas peradeniyensis TaxID=2745488 RepID=A0ABT2VCU5_9PSED|nr:MULTISPECIES: hypothetical protein [Pseudomonas]MCU7239537.1 hypothetical protein [Pseudomonas peradeniyensis]MCU7280834.1 hypothetical protein [Pseudomonas peradeniyensis]QZA56482.1 hypothetical protein K2O50_10735 [Pseudomonas sp. 2hn]
MDEWQLAELAGLKQSARGQVTQDASQKYGTQAIRLTVGEIDERAILAHEAWHPDHYDFGWDRVLKWKTRPAHARALDIALWHDDHLAGMCWASPQASKEKIMVLYLQRNPDSTLPTRSYVAPLCLSGVRYYALMLGLQWVVIRDPLPQARAAYERDGFRQIKGIGLAYKLAHGYASPTLEGFPNGE